MPENVNTSALNIGTQAEEAEDNRPVMIKVDHVSMSFNMASEQLNNLKEYAIAIARHKLFFEEFKALDDVSFEVRKGDVFGILGTNGSGKSTMLKVIAGVLEPTKGSCTVNGNIAPLIELGAGFDMDLSARENIYLNGALLGYSHKFIDEHFDDIVEVAEVEKFLDMPMKNYSSGMISRIAFAIATVIVPEILLVDEVLSVGDFMFQKKCEDRIKQLIEEHGVTVLIVSHSNDQIARLCNKAIWIEKGHTRLQGDAKIVTRVYGGLGGRTGSAKSEQKVFERLVQSAQESISSDDIELISGENISSTNAKVLINAWQSKPTDTIVLAAETTHANVVIANALAGAYQAPLLPIHSENLGDAIERLLYEYRPRTIIVVDNDGHAKPATEALDGLPWNPSIVRFDQREEIFEFSCSILRFGLEKRLWGQEIAVIGFDDNTISLTACPYLYRSRCPVVVIREDNGEHVKYIQKLLGTESPQRIVSIGPQSASEAKALADALGKQHLSLGNSSLPGSCLEVTSFVLNDACKAHPETPQTLYVTSQTLSQWSLLASAGSALGASSGAILRLDSTSLDNMAETLEFVEKHRSNIARIIFIGESELTGVERTLLYAASACISPKADPHD